MAKKGSWVGHRLLAERLLEQARLAQGLVGALAKLRLLVAHLGALAVARSLELDPDAFGGHLGDRRPRPAPAGLKRAAGPLQVGSRRDPDRDRRRRGAIARSSG